MRAMITLNSLVMALLLCPWLCSAPFLYHIIMLTSYNSSSLNACAHWDKPIAAQYACALWETPGQMHVSIVASACVRTL